jgi:ABC-2 type transport system ATP-binding protein
LATGTPTELKALALTKARFAFAHTQQPPEVLRSQEGVLDAWPSGDGMRLILEPGAHPPLELSPATPSLEDVFVVLTRQSQSLLQAGGAI